VSTLGRRTPIIQRLVRRIDRRGPDECWPWTGRTVKGRGKLRLNDGKDLNCARALWAIVHGPIPQGYGICHTCDNRICLNMRHLFLGTQQDNIADMVAKGRQRGPCGERARHNKLTAAQVTEIRALIGQRVNRREIAARYGMAVCSIHDIRARRSWKHIP
jgi:hypothetical protein